MRTLALPCLSSSLHNHTNTYHFRCSSSSFIFFTPYTHKRSHFLTPCSSLRQTKKQQQQLRKINTTPSGLKRLFSPNNNDADQKESEPDSDFQDATALKGTLLAGLLLLGVVGGFASVGYIYKDQINSFLNYFSVFKPI
jgi:hypothetical protein